MPIPIRPVGDPSPTVGGDLGSQFMGIDVDTLAAAIGAGNGKSASIKVTAEAGDADAELLLDLWNRGKIIAEAETAEEKRYSVPDGFGNDSLMRLKAASLVHGDSNIIKFTSKAIRVIKTIVLAEPNSFTKGAIKKPYSIILAENKAKSATRSTLAFERTASIIVEAQQNIPIEDQYMPRRDMPYVASRRIVKREGTSNKQYVVRMFEVNGQYSVVAWNGRNEPGRSLTLQPKGSFPSRNRAQQVMDDLISSKLGEGYAAAGETSNESLYGIPPQTTTPRATTAPRTTATPPATPAPRTAPQRAPRRSVFDTATGRPVERSQPAERQPAATVAPPAVTPPVKQSPKYIAEPEPDIDNILSGMDELFDFTT